MNNCIKCGGTEIHTRFVERGELIDRSSPNKVISEFTCNSEYDYFFKVTASKEHLKKSCRNCGYSWRERALDDSTVG